MSKRAFITISGVLVGAALVACVGASSSDEASSAGDLVTSPAEAKACAVRSTYLGASLPDFRYLTFDALPYAARQSLSAQWGTNPFESVSSFAISNVGLVYVTEQASAFPANAARSTLQFFDTNGAPLAAASAYNNSVQFSLSYSGGDAGASAVLRCTGGGGSADASYTPRDSSAPWYPSSDGGPYPTYDSGPYVPATDAGPWWWSDGGR